MIRLCMEDAILCKAMIRRLVEVDGSSDSPGLNVGGWRFLCPFLRRLHIVILIGHGCGLPQSSGCILECTQECRSTRFQPRGLYRMGQNLFTVHLIEGASSRPLASELDVFTPRLSVVVVKPLLYFLDHMRVISAIHNNVAHKVPC